MLCHGRTEHRETKELIHDAHARYTAQLFIIILICT